MRWVASTPVVIFGTSYGAGQSVNTESWTNDQIHQQVYLGHIVPDTRIGSAQSFSGSGGDWNNAHTDLRTVLAAAGAFTAPESGKVLVISSVTGRAKDPDGILRIQVRIGQGPALRQGAEVALTPQAHYRGSQHYLQEVTHLVSNLTAGERYNACHAIENTAGGAVILNPPRIQIIPVST